MQARAPTSNNLTRLVTEAPSGDEWAHELKFDGYRMELDRGDVRLLTCTGLDWTSKYPAIAAALNTIPARQVYLDGELWGVRPDGVTSIDPRRGYLTRRGAGNAQQAEPRFLRLLAAELDSVTVPMVLTSIEKANAKRL